MIINIRYKHADNGDGQSLYELFWNTETDYFSIQSIEQHSYIGVIARSKYITTPPDGYMDCITRLVQSAIDIYEAKELK